MGTKLMRGLSKSEDALQASTVDLPFRRAADVMHPPSRYAP